MSAGCRGTLRGCNGEVSGGIRGNLVDLGTMTLQTRKVSRLRSGSSLKAINRVAA